MLAGLAVFGALALVHPTTAAALAAKEGPLEQLGHWLLVLALFGWLGAVWHIRGRERWLCAVLALACAVMLGEELDWGGVLGWTPLADAVRDAVGHRNLHNAWKGGSYVLFAIPLAVIVGVMGWRRGDAPGPLPRRSDAIGLALLAAASLLGALARPQWEPRLDEVMETLLYAGLAVIALRPSVATSGLSTSV